MSNVDSWCKACGEVDLPSELQDLEDAIHHHQGIDHEWPCAIVCLNLTLEALVT